MVNIALPLPPLHEQARLVQEIDRRLSILEEEGLLLEATLKRSYTLKQSVLKTAFRGQLVEQDPSDEPASVLLERIRAEREAQPKPMRKTRKKGGRNAAKVT